MSTLAATKADGFYYPPDWTPEGGSASLARKFNKNGSLGKRANKLHEGKLTVRFSRVLRRTHTSRSAPTI